MLQELFFSGFLGKRVHLGVTGSIAAYKALDLLRALIRCNIQVSVTLTESATKFVSPLSFEALGADCVYSTMFESKDVFAHLAPGQNCDCLAIVPATANILAKLAHGIADDLLSCQALAFSGSLIAAPAMNPKMWNAPATQENLKILSQRSLKLISPDFGDMACGESGKGRLADISLVTAQILREISPQDLTGKKILLTLGPTREAFDPARFWSNPSTGKMGVCLALAAWMRGAEVTAVCGPIDFELPSEIRRIDVQTARQMNEAVLEHWPDMDIACAAAAVADFAPVPYSAKGKYKKQGQAEELSFDFRKNPDILLNMSKAKGAEQLLIGFAAETENFEEQAKAKLQAKNLDMILCNPIAQEDCGFASSRNQVFYVDRQGRSEAWPQLAKSEVAWRIWDQLSLLSN